MRTNWVLTTAVMAMSVTAAVGAQSAKAMHQPSKGDAMSVAYTGCVESVNHGGAFLLTKIDSVHSMRDDKTMKHQQAPMADEKMDPMSATSFALAGSTNLSKHIGQKVSVTGSLSDGSMGTMRQDLSTLTIKTLKVIAKSCS